MKRFAFVILALALVGNVPAAQDLERLFKAAVNTETVDRNCKAAIEQYKKVAAGTNRALAAQALLRMAGCYQQLGDAEARTVLERIVRQYGDQKDVRAVAAQRLASLGPSGQSPDGIIAKKILEEADVFGSISPDGRYVSFMDPDTSDLAVGNLVTNETRRLTTHPRSSRNEFAEYRFSHLTRSVSPMGGRIQMANTSCARSAATVVWRQGCSRTASG